MDDRAPTRLRRSLTAVACCVTVASTPLGCEPPASVIDAAAVHPDVPLSDSAASSVATQAYIPYLLTPFQRVYAPDGGRYLNDHTVVRGNDGMWHVYGITNTGEGDPSTETHFLHAIAPALTGPWTDQEDILVADATLDETILWAPHAVPLGPTQWVMYYEGGNSDPATTDLGLRRATSDDLFTWERAETTPTPALRAPGGRDPYLLHDGDRWLLYSVGGVASGTDDASGDGLAYGQIVVTESADITNASGWTTPAGVLPSDPRAETAPGWMTPVLTVAQDPQADYGWGSVESPTVVLYGGMYYLFVTATSMWASNPDYSRTLVFRSVDALYFPWQPIAMLPAHAAEIVQDTGQYYITSCGWPGVIGDENRGLSIAQLGWAPDQLDPSGGAEAASCPLSTAPCGPLCADAESDPANCGGCGIVCGAGSQCRGGNCM